MSKRTPEHSFSPPMVGGSSLLVIFAVLCLTVFTLLALETAQADNRLSDASIQAVTEYYATDLQAQRILAQLRAGETVAGVTYEGDIYSYSCPISDTQQLLVEVQQTADGWIIQRWQGTAAMPYTDMDQ